MRKLYTLICSAVLAVLFITPEQVLAQAKLELWKPSIQASSAEISFVDVDASVVLPKGESSSMVLDLPQPEGGSVEVTLREAPVMPASLQARYPNIRTYLGTTADGHAVALTQTPDGASVYVRDPAGSWGVEPISRSLARVGTTTALSGDEPGPALACGFEPSEESEESLAEAFASSPAVQARSGARVQVQKRVYTVALACTGEFGRAKGGTKESVMATFAEAMNILNAITLTETALGFELHPNNDTLIFTDPARDPYTNATLGSGLLSQNPLAINNRIPVGEYDLGHVFTVACSDVGGVVSGNACSAFGKARGVTCHYSGLRRIVEEVMAHEVAHQFNVSHSWNNCPGNDGQRAGIGAFEPGSGSTIMSYQGACPGNNISSITPENYYHVGSLQQFENFVVNGDGAECADVVEVDNQLPVIDWPYANGFAIPARTPFTLSAEATDADGDALLYNWEQYNLGPVVQLGNQNGDSPIFRSVPPSASGNTRFFPDERSVQRGVFDDEELLPAPGRNLKFRMTVRDRSSVGGGTVWEQLDFDVADGEAFAVTSQNSPATTYVTGGFAEVSWNVAGSNAAPVNCSSVNIMLSIDGGTTYPYMLAEATSNDGSEGVNLPEVESSRARIKVEAVDNIFYSLSNSNFTILTPTEPGFIFAPGASTRFVCGAQTEEIEFFSQSLLNYDSAISVRIISDIPAGVSATLSQDTLSPGESTILTVDLSDFGRTDSLSIQVEATGPGVEPTVRTIIVDAVSTDFSDLALLGPDEGEDGVSIVPTFRFTPSVAGEEYELEVSESPTFGLGSIEVENPDPNGTKLDIQLEPNTLYFWRIKPISRCDVSTQEFPINAFHTYASDCELYTQTEPILIPPSVATTVEAVIPIAATGTVNDLNLPLVDVRYSEINDIRVLLEAPDGTSQRLISRRCGGTNRLTVGFDDEAALPFSCDPTPNDGRVMQPQNPLSVFSGLEIQGNWKIQVEVVTPSTSGGEFQAFEIEFCADIVSQSPSFEVDLIGVPTGGFQRLNKLVLRGEDLDNPASDLTYVIIEAPKRGRIQINQDSSLRVGGRFSQQQAQDDFITYKHDGSAPERDTMVVVLTDNAGNVTERRQILFDIDDQYTVGTNDLLSEQIELTLAPNPTSANSVLRWSEPSKGGSLLLLDATGRVLNQQRIVEGQVEALVLTEGLATGIYHVNYRGVEGARTLRLVVR